MPERPSQPPSSQPGSPSAAGVVHEIRWLDICPWLILVKALRAALLLRVLVLASVGVVLTHGGWAVISQWFDPPLAMPPMLREALPVLQIDLNASESITDSAPSAWQCGTLISGWYWLAKPFLMLGDQQLSWQAWIGTAMLGIWAIFVWGLFGGAICRITSLYLARGELLGPLRAVRQTVSVWLDTIGSPLVVLLAAIAHSVPLLLLGALLRFDLFAVFAAIFWGFVIAWGLMLAVILVGLLLGWPLMWACLATERSDAFDGVSRCYAYVYQRPLQFGLLVLLAAVLGLAGDVVVTFFSVVTVSLSEWALSWGIGTDRALQLFASDIEASPAPIATRLINNWKWAVQTVAISFPVASLWAMTVGIYLVLRRQVDATEMDEITLADGTIQAGLPSEPSKPSTRKGRADSPTG